MHKRYFLSLITIFSFTILYAQDTIQNPVPDTFQLRVINTDAVMHPMHRQDVATITNKIVLYEDSLIYFADSLYNTPEFGKKLAGNYEFIRIMKAMLKQENSYNYPFDSLRKKINIMDASNKSFRLYNWEFINQDGLSRYFGVIQTPDSKIHPLIDVSTQIAKQQEDSILTKMNWFGAFYYNILERKTDNGILYFLIGLNSSFAKSEKKVIDCLYFNAAGEPVLGAPVFQSLTSKTPKVCNRFIAEYQKDAHITMNWDEENKMIIMDHLESDIGDFAKRYSFVSDGTYDGLKWNGLGWQLIPNAVQINIMSDGKAPLQEGIQKKELRMIDETENANSPQPSPKKKKK